MPDLPDVADESRTNVVRVASGFVGVAACGATVGFVGVAGVGVAVGFVGVAGVVGVTVGFVGVAACGVRVGISSTPRPSRYATV